MERVIEPEWLDELPADEPNAVRSRADLRRLNWFMGHVGILTRALRNFPKPNRVMDIGCGDGAFALKLAAKLGWRGIEIVLVDQNLALPDPIRGGFAAMDCVLKPFRIDALRGLDSVGSVDFAIANLFLHHLDASALRTLFRTVASNCDVFIACEPRRSSFALLASRLVGLIGCNKVTRHDAVVSVRAGFHDRQLSHLWPTDAVWTLDERSAGAFSHLFVAHKL